MKTYDVTIAYLYLDLPEACGSLKQKRMCSFKPMFALRSNDCTTTFLRRLKTNSDNVDFSVNQHSKRRHKHIILTLFIAVLTQAPFVFVRGQTSIRITNIQPNPICVSSTSSRIIVQAKTTGVGNFGPNNIFTVQLSDDTGSFNNATVIAARPGDKLPPPIKAEIPAYTRAGKYLIRVVSNNPVNVSNSVEFVINDFEAPLLSLIKQDVSDCGDGSDGILKGFALGGTEPYTFTFYGRDQEQVSEDSIVVNDLTPGKYLIVVSDGNNCKVIGDTDIIQSPAPTIEISTKGNVSSCDPENGGFFTIRVFPRTGIYATAIKPYYFQMTRQEMDTTGVSYEQINPVIRFSDLDEGNYKVIMKDGAGCASNYLQNIPISRDTPIAVRLGSQQNPSCTGNDGQIVVFASLGSRSTYRYSLSEDGGISYGPEQPGHRFIGLGTQPYVVKARDSRGCEDTLHVTLKTPNCPSGIEGSMSSLNLISESSADVQVFPNPTTTAFTLNVQSNNKDKVQIIVTDIYGNKLYRTMGDGNRQYTFGGEFRSGIYLVQVIQGKQIQRVKVIKEN